jgi:hypothetical protein
MIPTQAAAALIASLRQPPEAHAIWVQTRVNKETGEAESILMVAINPQYADAITVPNVFYGYRVERHPWPQDEREVLGVVR